MAHTSSIKELEKRKKALVAKNDELRDTLAGRFNELSVASFWITQGIDMAQNFMGNRGILSTALNFLRR